MTFHLIVLVIVPSLNYATQRALIFARTISKNVVAVTVDSDKDHAEQVRQAVREEDPDIHALVLEDPYHLNRIFRMNPNVATVNVPCLIHD